MTRAAKPTSKQAALLLALANGSAGLSWRRRPTEALLRRGWVTGTLEDGYYMWVRITPDGLRALADAVERDGLPDIHRAAPRRLPQEALADG